METVLDVRLVTVFEHSHRKLKAERDRKNRCCRYYVNFRVIYVTAESACILDQVTIVSESQPTVDRQREIGDEQKLWSSSYEEVNIIESHVSK